MPLFVFFPARASHVQCAASFWFFFLITSFLSPVGLLPSYDQKLVENELFCSVLIESPLVFLSFSLVKKFLPSF